MDIDHHICLIQFDFHWTAFLEDGKLTAGQGIHIEACSAFRSRQLNFLPRLIGVVKVPDNQPMPVTGCVWFMGVYQDIPLIDDQCQHFPDLEIRQPNPLRLDRAESTELQSIRRLYKDHRRMDLRDDAWDFQMTDVRKRPGLARVIGESAILVGD